MQKCVKLKQFLLIFSKQQCQKAPVILQRTNWFGSKSVQMVKVQYLLIINKMNNDDLSSKSKKKNTTQPNIQNNNHQNLNLDSQNDLFFVNFQINQYSQAQSLDLQLQLLTENIQLSKYDPNRISQSIQSQQVKIQKVQTVKKNRLNQIKYVSRFLAKQENQRKQIRNHKKQDKVDPNYIPESIQRKLKNKNRSSKCLTKNFYPNIGCCIKRYLIQKKISQNSDQFMRQNSFNLQKIQKLFNNQELHPIFVEMFIGRYLKRSYNFSKINKINRSNFNKFLFGLRKLEYNFVKKFTNHDNIINRQGQVTFGLSYQRSSQNK